MSSETCRLCNASGTKLSSSIYDEVCRRFLELIPSIKIDTKLIQLPSAVCQLCFGKAKISYDFITRIEQAQQEFEKQKKSPKKPLKIENSFEQIQLSSGLRVRKLSVIKTEMEEYDNEEPDFVEDLYEPEEDFIESEDDDDDYKPIKVSPKKKKTSTVSTVSNKVKEGDDREIYIDAPIHFTCGKCRAKYNTLDELAIHMKAKSCFTPDPAECKVCGKTFEKKKSLYSHLKTHMPKDKVMCELCAKEFSNTYDLETHMETVHRRVVRRDCVFKCTNCHDMFNSHLDLLDHVKAHKKEKKEAPRLCEICARVCPNLKAYQSHMTIHKDKKPHNCTECGKGFSKAFLLVQHMHIHTGIKAYVCDICNKSYAKRDSLRIHKKRDHSDFIIP